MKISCGIFANIAPLYTKPLWYELSASSNVRYVFYSSYKGYSGIKTIATTESKLINPDSVLDWHFLENILVRNRIIYQKGLISKCMSTDHDAYILYGEMHSISNWIAALICKLRRKPLLFWGHGLYGNEKNLKRWIRLLFYRLPDINLVFGNRSRKLMIESGFDPAQVVTVYNSLDYKNHKRLLAESNETELNGLKEKLFKERNNQPVIIFIGRLTREKKLTYLLESVSVCKQHGRDFNCLIVGDGEEMEHLKTLAHVKEISDSVFFFGASYDEEMNARLIMLSECCVSPGNVGLTAIHCLSLGTPVITHDNFYNQGPESEVIMHNETGLFFKENDVEDLSYVIEDLINNKKKKRMSSNCIRVIDEYWNPVKQTAIINNAIINLTMKR